MEVEGERGGEAAEEPNPEHIPVLPHKRLDECGAAAYGTFSVSSGSQRSSGASSTTLPPARLSYQSSVL